MATQAVRKLTDELGTTPPDGFSVLDEADIDFLATALHNARKAQEAGLDQAAEESLKIVPAIARGPVRRILFR